MNWKPIDIIRLVALIGGFFLAVLGAYLMWLGVGAEGTIDIKSSMISGTVKSGSAGLFIIFFGFSIVLFVLATLTASNSEKPSIVKSNSKNQGVGIAFFCLVAGTFISGALAALGFGEGFGAISAFMAFMTIFTGVAYLETRE